MEVVRACPEDRPLMAQIAGSDPVTMVKAAHLLASQNTIDGIDVNFGCPQKCADQGNYGVFLATRHTEQALAVVKVRKSPYIYKSIRLNNAID